jgi:antitoxin MazE
VIYGEPNRDVSWRRRTPNVKCKACLRPFSTYPLEVSHDLRPRIYNVDTDWKSVQTSCVCIHVRGKEHGYLGKKWGNSAAVRIPAIVLETAKIKLGQPVSVRAVGNRIVIEPVGSSYELDALVAAITPENRHDEMDFGSPVDRELL